MIEVHVRITSFDHPLASLDTVRVVAPRVGSPVATLNARSGPNAQDPSLPSLALNDSGARHRSHDRGHSGVADFVELRSGEEMSEPELSVLLEVAQHRID